MIRLRLSRGKVLLQRAKAAQRQGRWKEAYEAYVQVLPKDDRRFGVLVQMGHMSKELGLFQQAESHYLEALALKPQDWDLNVQLGHFFNRVGDLEQARYWYAKASEIRFTPEISELLHSIKDAARQDNVKELRQQALNHMDAGRFGEALPQVIDLYEVYGLADFDVIAGHAYRELGRYAEAEEMYRRYFDRCIKSNSKNINDALFHLINVMEILENRTEIIEVFSRLKNHLYNCGDFARFGSEQSELMQSQIGKAYGVLRK